MKKFILSSIVLTLALCTFAQADGSKKILEKVSKKYKAQTTMTMSFTMNLKMPDSEVDEDRSGKVYIKGKKFRIETEDAVIACDNETIYTYDGDEVTIDSYDPDPDEITPANVFTIWESGFMYRLAESAKVGGVSCKVIELTPTDKSKSYFKIKLFVNEATSELKKAEILEKSGARTTITMGTMSTTKFGDEKFKIDAVKEFPDAEINDMR